MPADPHSGSKVWKAPDREIGKPGENRGKVIAHRNLQPSAAFHDRENRRNFRPGQWTARCAICQQAMSQACAACWPNILNTGITIP